MSTNTEGQITIQFFPLGDAGQIQGSPSTGALDLGTVSAQGAAERTGVQIERSAGAFDVKTAIGVRVGSEATRGETGMLKAWLEASVAPYVIYFDNIPLTSQPIPLIAHAPMGVITRHEIKVVVPADVDASHSQLQALIGLEAIEN